VWLSSAVGLSTGRRVYNLELHKTRVPLQNQYFTTHLYDWFNFYKTAKYVLLIRDPRDAIRSHTELKIRNGVSEDIWNNHDFFRHEAGLWASYFERALEMDSIIVQYEHLCLWPVEILEWILRFAKQPMREKAIPSVMREAGSREYYQQHCLKWQRDSRFTTEHNGIIFSRVGDIMKHYGYGPYGHTQLLFNKKW